MKINILLGHAFPVPRGHTAGVSPVEDQCWRIGNEMAAQGHDVMVYSRAWGQLPTAEQFPSGLRIVRLRGYDWTRRRYRDVGNALHYGLRLVNAVRDADVQVCKTFFFPFLARVLGRPRGVICVGLHREPKRHLKAYSLLLKNGCGSRVRFTAVSRFVREKAERICPAMKGHVEVVYNPVDMQVFKPGGAKWAEPTVLYAGRIVPEKGVTHLVEAFLRIKRTCDMARLRVVGPVVATQNSDETLVHDLRRRLRMCPWPHDFSFPGFKTGRQLVEEYQKAWVICYPSFSGEAFANVVLEAMACGTPVVTTSFGAFPEQFEDGREGFHVPPRDADALADRLLRVLEDEGLRHDCGRAARARACEFGLDRIVNQYLRAFEKFLQQ